MRVIEQQDLNFFVEIHRPPGGARVVVQGELDLVSAPLLEAALDRVETNNGQSTVLLDLSKVGFVDCAGWRAVDNAASALEGRGGGLIVVEASGPVRTFMRLVGDHRLELGSDGADGSHA